ncbi:MAG: sulfatase-like hydrolase/transferase [Deltaproteobacteria bacterium]|nr:sulfatase-like hydrolase/transferase [Deltaproteobacteria bacterium]
MSGTPRPTVGDVARAQVAACVVATFVLTLADGVGAMSRVPAPSVLGVGVLALAGWPLGALLASAVVVARGAVGRALRRGETGGAALAGVLDVAWLLVLAVYAQSPRALGAADTRTWVLGAGVALGAAAGASWHRWVRPRPWLARVLASVVALAATVGIALVRWNGDPWFRLALTSCFVVAFACATEPWWLRASARSVIAAACGLAVLGAIAWVFVLPASRDGRLALYHRSSHVRTWAYAIDRAFYAPREWPAEPGRADAPRTRSDPSMGGAAIRGAARGHDVLLLSVDSLRWDAANELGALRRALGPHADFRLAVSPAPATRDSLPATLRGRAVSELRIEPAPGTNGDVLWRDPSPTIGHELARAGYRAVTFATSNQSDPRIGIQSGFDTVYLVNRDASPGARIRSPFALSYTPVHELAPPIRRLARETPGRLCLWVHFMEPHYGYHWSPTEEGPHGMPAFRKSVRYASRRIAEVIRDWRSIRRRPFVVAVFGDHGEELGEHGGSFHGGSVHAEQSRVVWLLAGAGVPAARPSAPVSTAAIPATVLDLLGLQVPPSMTIGSLVPAMAGQGEWPDVAVTEMRSPYRAALGYTTPRWRLIRDARHDVEQLFDLRADPYETRDLATSHPAELSRIRRAADDWDARH